MNTTPTNGPAGRPAAKPAPDPAADPANAVAGAGATAVAGAVHPTTSLNGAPAGSDEHSLCVSADGAIALHDHYLVEKLAQFNRERIPERVVHAKGGGAFGRFEVTQDVSQWTKAALFQPGAQTELLARFSSVAGELGSPDTWRDVRGFALKFYTSQGNYDMVGNNTPVFFIRDGMKFPDFIHSQKRMPGSHLRDLDMQWDFWTLSPETAHQVTYLMGDRGVPLSWRHMQGYSSHTYQWVNAQGERFWVKYHFLSHQGVRNITATEADQLAGTDADHYIRDLWDAIERGDYPSWTMKVQVMPYEEAKNYRFNPFDLTKIWPHEDYPLTEVGRLTLNRNPENYFSQIEQATFAPSNLVPGISVSPDKMLLARMFAYSDAHRYRVGTNSSQLPVNAPRTDVHSYTRDGAMRFTVDPASAPVYAPNSLGGPAALASSGGAPTAPSESPGWSQDGELVRSAASLHAEDNDFSQARTMIAEVFDAPASGRFVDTLAGQYRGLTRPEVKARFFEYWEAVDRELPSAIRAAL